MTHLLPSFPDTRTFSKTLSQKVRLATWFFAFTFLGLATLTSLSALATEDIGEISVGKNPRRAVILPNGSEVYVSNIGDNSVSIINTKTDKVIKNIKVGKEPNALVVSKDGKRIYVGQNGTGVSVIDTENKRVLITINTDGPVKDMAINPLSGQKIYLAMEYNGLGKIEIAPDGNYSYSVIDRTSCPEAVVFTPDGKRAYINYQCAPFPGSYGHDPIFVFDADKDQRVAEITHFPDGKRIANVGSFMAISTKGFIWANGADACSRKRTNSDPGGYDFEGCPPLDQGEEWQGRGIINIIDTHTNKVIRAFRFPGRDIGSEYSLAAIISTFFPDGSKIAVSTPSRILIFDTGSLNQIESIPIANAGNLAFTPDGNRAYVPIPDENKVKILQIKPVQVPAQRSILDWYLSLWRKSFFQTLGLHISFFVTIFFIVLYIFSIRFALAFPDQPKIRFFLDMGVFFLKQRSRLAKRYLRQFGRDIQTLQSEVKVVPLPLKSKKFGNLNTEEWMKRFIGRIKSAGHYRVCMSGRGGIGKTVLMRELALRLIDSDYVPMLLKAADYEGEKSIDEWIGRILLKDIQIPARPGLWRRIPNLVYLVDQASEVPLRFQEAFWHLVQSQFSPGVEELRMLVAGRFIGDPATGVGQEIQWEDIIEADELQDDDIMRLGSAYLDPTGQSLEIQTLPKTIRDIMTQPTAFVVSHYVKAQRESVSSIRNQRELFQEILRQHVGKGEFATRPSIVKLILEGLVKNNILFTSDRGLPSQKTLVSQVRKIVVDLQLKEKYGEQSVPDPASFVDRLLPSGLVYPIGIRFLFFHDSFEDWLVEEAERET